MLFGESTNQGNASLDGAAPMDISLVDLSMRDIHPEVEKPDTKPTLTRKVSTVKGRTNTKAAPAAKRRTTKKRVVEVVIS
jgi:NAD-dependent histone deacetylase SIR2